MGTDLGATFANWAKSGNLELLEQNCLDDATVELVFEVPDDRGGVCLLRACRLPRPGESGDRTADC